jgi:tetratricopeptide (TPR) repeat protein
LGLAFKQMGQKAEAAKEIRSAIDGGYRPAGAWNNLGLLYRDLGRYPEAEQAFLEGLENEPDHWHAAYNLARIYLSQARVSDARQWLIEARRRARDAGDDTSAVEAILEQIGSEIPENR